MLRRAGDAIGFTVEQASSVMHDGERVSSSAIRDSLWEGDLERALQLYLQARQLGVNDAVLHFNLGNTFYQQENWAEAIEAYQQALRLNPDDIDAKNNLEMALKQQEQQRQQQQQQRQGGSSGQNDQQEQEHERAVEERLSLRLPARGVA